YHERTKYDPQTIASKSKGLDWSQQPYPFKEYKIGQTFDLKPYLSRQTVPKKVDFWRHISRILGCSYGLTAKIATMGSPLYLRSAPSAGGLYPAEVYLISRGTEFLPAGLYSYQGQSHSLLLFWESDVWTNLQSACFWNPVLENTDIALVTSAIFYRSAWRYEDRAYRRIFLDTGHLLGNIELSASINDYRAHLIGGFNDSQMNELLYLDSEKESVMTVIPLADLLNIRQNLPPSTTALPSATTTLYPKIAEGELLNSLHQATIIATDEKIEANITPSNWEDKYNFPFCLKVSVTSRPVNWGEDLIDLESTMLKRRSTRAYSGASLSLDELRALLHFTYQPQDYADQNLDPNPDYFDLDLLETFIAVSAVTGLEEGCYYYAPKAQELRQIRFKNFRQELHYLCLGQDLGRDAAAVVFHTADLSKAVAKYGDRVYRYLHADAGHLGQRLNLAAIHLGLGVSGIGGFFDDQVNEVLGIPSDEAVIYITTLGRPKVF
ncbi:MAG: SagB/ThcOx family dehydrogenase, partial [Dolichospermum sp.]